MGKLGKALALLCGALALRCGNELGWNLRVGDCVELALPHGQSVLGRVTIAEDKSDAYGAPSRHIVFAWEDGKNRPPVRSHMLKQVACE